MGTVVRWERGDNVVSWYSAARHRGAHQARTAGRDVKGALLSGEMPTREGIPPLKDPAFCRASVVRRILRKTICAKTRKGRRVDKSERTCPEAIDAWS
jgi:hypothetical protein